MMTAHPAGLVVRPALDPRERAGAASLLALCNAHEGLDLKLDLDAAPLRPGDAESNHILFYAPDGALAGYCALDRGVPIELCGMVRPAQRRRGIGRALLRAAAAECRRRGKDRAYLLCEEASASGHAFVSAAGAIYRFAEHRMELAARPPQPPPDAAVRLRRAGRADVDTLARLRADAFEEPVDDAWRGITAEIDDTPVRFYLALLDETPFGSFKLLRADGRAFIYAFGVLPAYRRRGLGRQMLNRLIEMVQSEDQARIGLEVETDNSGALALYRACGFRITTTYGYYRLDLEGPHL